MVNFINEKVITTPGISQNYAYTQKRLPSEQKEKNVLSQVKSVDLKSDKSQKLISAGLITGGGLLLYYGLTRPGKAKIFDKFIQNKIFNMEIIANRYRTFVQDIVGSSFVKSAEYISEYKASRFLNPSDSVIQIRMFNDPEKIANAQDLAFDAILNVNRSNVKAGNSDFGEFASMFDDIMRRTTGEIDSAKRRTSMELDDFMHLPKIKEEFSADQVEEAEGRLIAANRSLDLFMDELKKFRLDAVSKHQFAQMADAVVQSRHLQTKTKQNIVNAAFEKVKDILKLGDDFVPLYNRGKYDVGSLEEITKYLRPQCIPKRIQKQTEPNVYLDTVMKRDLRNLSEKEIKEIFYTTPYENNLKDLRYIIDRYRLRHAVALAQNSDDASVYQGIVIKLEYLSNVLTDFGKGQLLERCNKDFGKMSVGQRHSALYYISTISRRLGYESLEAMDKDLYKNSSVYRDLNLHSYMPIIKDNPYLYFVE